MTEKTATKTILDRNGNPKTISFKVSGETSVRPKWRGTEFGFDENDYPPEGESSFWFRQRLQNAAGDKDYEILARRVRVDKEEIDLVVQKHSVIVFLCKNSTVSGDAVREWMSQSGYSADIVLIDSIEVSSDYESVRHHLSRLS
jgi:hypothetical protein